MKRYFKLEIELHPRKASFNLIDHNGDIATRGVDLTPTSKDRARALSHYFNTFGQDAEHTSVEVVQEAFTE